MGRERTRSLGLDHAVSVASPCPFVLVSFAAGSEVIGDTGIVQVLKMLQPTSPSMLRNKGSAQATISSAALTQPMDEANSLT